MENLVRNVDDLSRTVSRLEQEAGDLRTTLFAQYTDTVESWSRVAKALEWNLDEQDFAAVSRLSQSDVASVDVHDLCAAYLQCDRLFMDIAKERCLGLVTDAATAQEVGGGFVFRCVAKCFAPQRNCGWQTIKSGRRLLPTSSSHSSRWSCSFVSRENMQ